MPTTDFILQGLTEKTHTDAIRRIFDIPNIQQVIISVAFINEEGVRLLENELRLAGNKIKVFAGIRNDITSYQGLSKLFRLDNLVYAVDTGARNTVFHPKLYLAKGSTQARLVVGSANLTLGGLNNNIEAGIALDFDLSNSSDREFVENIENKFIYLPRTDPEHVFQITTDSQLISLQNEGRLIDELEALPPRPTMTRSSLTTDSISRIRLNVPRLQRTIRRRRFPQAIAEGAVTPAENLGTDRTEGLELIWESPLLTERDLNIPHGSSTNPTGSINLDKGLLSDEIDFRSYFRDVVFAHLPWSPRSNPSIEEAEATFKLVIKGISRGEFPLSIRHTTSTTSRAYQQHNAMTRLSWGPMKEYVARRDLIGRTLSLYKDLQNPNRFVIEID